MSEHEEALVLVAGSHDHQVIGMEPEQMVINATKMANVLKDVIVKQNLFIELKGNQHVKVEAWSTLGTMLNILAKERSVVRHEDGSYEAFVDLVNYNTGLVVGGGSGFVGMDEKNWKDKPEYARRSMAITRATSKAYKTCFSWIIALAGYNPTPAEEMDFATTDRTTSKRAKPVAPAENAFYHEGCKKDLATIFSELGIEDKDKKKAIHQHHVNEKTKLSKLREATIAAAAEYDNPGGVEIPFG